MLKVEISLDAAKRLLAMVEEVRSATLAAPFEQECIPTDADARRYRDAADLAEHLHEAMARCAMPSEREHHARAVDWDLAEHLEAGFRAGWQAIEASARGRLQS